MIELLAILGIGLGLVAGYCLRMAAEIAEASRHEPGPASDLEEGQLP